MTAESGSPLFDSWPVFERGRTFELGLTIDAPVERLPQIPAQEVLGRNSAGWWDCDLSDQSLTWTSGVYDLFGLTRGKRVSRVEALSLYAEPSRAVLERLRSNAIDNARAFVLDAEIRPATGSAARWIRLIAMPVVEAERTVQLEGLKLLI